MGKKKCWKGGFLLVAYGDKISKFAPGWNKLGVEMFILNLNK